jgi:hypothetical protein
MGLDKRLDEILAGQAIKSSFHGSRNWQFFDSQWQVMKQAIKEAICEEEGHKWTQVRGEKIDWPDGSSSHKSHWECMRCPKRTK